MGWVHFQEEEIEEGAGLVEWRNTAVGKLGSDALLQRSCSLHVRNSTLELELDVMVNACNSSTRGTEAGRAEVQGCPQL